MAWEADLTVQTVSGNTLYASTSNPDGSPSNLHGTEDDTTISQVGVTVTYTDKVPDHMVVGSKFTLNANC